MIFLLCSFAGLFSMNAISGTNPYPKISEKDWSNLVRSLKNLEYQVKNGDTLSTISKEKLGSLNYWPKLWEVNQNKISNPHLLEPTQTLVFSESELLEIRNPANASEVQPTKKVKSSPDEIPDALLRPTFAHKHRLRFVSLSPQEILGIVTGAFEEKNYLSSDDLIYVGAFDKSKVIPGQKYAVLSDVKNSPFSGLMRVIGEIQIDKYGDDLALARVTEAQELIERGSKIAQIPILTLQEVESPAPQQMSSRIVLGESPESSLIFPGQLVILEGGNQRSMKSGYVFSVYDDQDPIFKSEKLIEPRSKGEIKVVWVGEQASVGYVLRTRSLVKVGDPLISSQHLSVENEKHQQYRQKTRID